MSSNNKMSNNNKMKGLLKGLRYISQIFDNEKEPEMKIGYPTDVKHVAHIGWDGPSVNSPSWMNEFKAPGFSSGPISLNGDIKDDATVKWVSEDSGRKGVSAHNSPVRDLPELPKSSRRQSSTSASAESPTREKSDKPRQPRRSSKSSTKDISDGSKPTRKPKDPSLLGSESPVPDIPKKSRRKKSKDSSNGGGSSRSRNRAQSPEVDAGSEHGSISRANNSDICESSGLNPFEDG